MKRLIVLLISLVTAAVAMYPGVSLGQKEHQSGPSVAIASCSKVYYNELKHAAELLRAKGVDAGILGRRRMMSLLVPPRVAAKARSILEWTQQHDKSLAHVGIADSDRSRHSFRE